MNIEKDTVAARDFASDTSHSRSDVQFNWWEFFSNYRLKKWRQEIKRLSAITGVSLEDVCKYIDVDVTDPPGFYRRMPKARNTFIAIGMAYKLPLETINDWLKRFGMKRKLYIKDILGDLVWIYLISINEKDKGSNINYFEKYEECKAEIEAIYLQLWNEDISFDKDTVSLEESIRHIEYDTDHIGLVDFVGRNMDAFKTAYAKPRRFLNNYVSRILRTLNEHNQNGRNITLNTLRGYLDDSMINYLSGSYETINVKAGVKGPRTSNIKAIPKNKRAHIALCLALGMTLEDLDEYLEMMGYSPLDGVNAEEGELINMINQWEKQHPYQKRYKEKYFYGIKNIEITPEQELQAVESMLQLRQDLKIAYECTQQKYDSKGKLNKSYKAFPYMND